MAGFVVDLAEDGATELASFFKLRQDVVVTDLIMPNCEGFETLLTVRAVAPNTKITAMSGGGRIGATSFLELAEHFGADVTLQKPCRTRELIARISSLCASRGTSLRHVAFDAKVASL